MSTAPRLEGCVLAIQVAYFSMIETGLVCSALAVLGGGALATFRWFYKRRSRDNAAAQRGDDNVDRMF